MLYFNYENILSFEYCFEIKFNNKNSIISRRLPGSIIINTKLKQEECQIPRACTSLILASCELKYC